MSLATYNRTKYGQFAPGQFGNPGGRPKDEHRVSELARSYSTEAIDTLVGLMRHGCDEEGARDSGSGAARPRMG